MTQCRTYESVYNHTKHYRYNSYPVITCPVLLLASIAKFYETTRNTFGKGLQLIILHGIKYCVYVSDYIRVPVAKEVESACQSEPEGCASSVCRT